VLPRIGKNRSDLIEVECAGRSMETLHASKMPPCVEERASFMAPFELQRTIEHPYTHSSEETHGHLKPTPLVHKAYSAACVPFRWMLRENVEGNVKKKKTGLAEQLEIGWVADREPELDFKSAWVQEGENQLALLDTFFSGLRENESLCFFYAKRTPLSEQPRRVIIGVGRVLSVGPHTEYLRKDGGSDLRGMLWERNVGHSIRPGFVDGFLFPYSQILELAAADSDLDPEDFVAFAPAEHFGEYSYGSELLGHDGAVASLVACAATLSRIKEKVEGPWEAASEWVDSELNRLWTARGAFPGLGSAISAFGYEWGFNHGTLLAHEIDLERERRGDSGSPWELLDSVMADPAGFDSVVTGKITPRLREGWTNLTAERSRSGASMAWISIRWPWRWLSCRYGW